MLSLVDSYKCVAEVVVCIFAFHEMPQCPPQKILHNHRQIVSPSSDLSYKGFQRVECFLDRVEIGRVRRKVEDDNAVRFSEFCRAWIARLGFLINTGKRVESPQVYEYSRYRRWERLEVTVKGSF
jgi:hypothetical protein